MRTPVFRFLSLPPKLRNSYMLQIYKTLNPGSRKVTKEKSSFSTDAALGKSALFGGNCYHEKKGK